MLCKWIEHLSRCSQDVSSFYVLCDVHSFSPTLDCPDFYTVLPFYLWNKVYLRWYATLDHVLITILTLRPGRQCWHSAASAFRQPSTTCSASLPAQHLYGRRTFSVAGPTVWNSLPDFIGDPTISADCFRRLLKTYLFARYWCIQRVRGSWR